MVYVMIAILTALTVLVASFLIVGIRVQGYFDLQTGTFVSDAFVFGNIHVFRYKAFECSGSFYSQINSRELKKIRQQETSGNHSGESAGDGRGAGYLAQKIAAFARAAVNCPGVRLKRLRAYLTIGTGDSMETSVIAASVAAVLGAVSVAMRDKLKVREGDVAVFPNFRHENTVLTFDVDAGYGTMSVIFAVARVVIKAKRSQTKARREAREAK